MKRRRSLGLFRLLDRLDFGGLGRIVSEMYFRFDTPGTYASIITVVLVSVFFYWGFGRIEKWLRPV